MVENDFMPAICYGWTLRCNSLGLKKGGAKAKTDMEAYMQGALAGLIATGHIDQTRGNQFAFLAAIDRLEEFVDKQAKEYTP